MFESAVAVDSSTFVSFDFEVDNSGSGSYDSHVGCARKYNNTIYLGWTYGNAQGSLVQPYDRSHGVPAGDCHGTMRGMSPRGYTDDELARLYQGLSAYAFKSAANQTGHG